ncbi:flavin-containing monooxygenase [Streptomyces sp. NPDC057271]|uniref:flavin-containing monooxygenase n=1 Tax=unclassified Streptomyces TaxID=2593676 RepID=UPI003629F398
MKDPDLVIIGAGQSGLAAAALAPRHGFTRTLVLEAAEQPGGAWPLYYDSLTLFSPARYSALPGMRFPGDPDRYPTRDEVVDYLRAYAGRVPAEIRTSTTVSSVVPAAGAWTVRADDGVEWTAPAAIAATGDYGHPHMPAIPGSGEFGGDVLHAADYRGPGRFTALRIPPGRGPRARVLVVGGGNSAIQIAAELGAVADVTLATRRPVGWMAQRPFGRDLHWWLRRSGLDVAPIRRLLTRAPVSVLDDGTYRGALERHGVDRREMFSRFTTEGVVWADGTKEPVDAVVLATGYRPAFPYLECSGVLDAEGRPLHRGGVATTAPGLGFIGMEFQRSFSSKTLRGVGRDAGHILGRLRR